MNNFELKNKLDSTSVTIEALANTLTLVLEDVMEDREYTPGSRMQTMYIPVLDYVCSQLFSVSDNLATQKVG